MNRRVKSEMAAPESVRIRNSEDMGECVSMERK